MLNPIQLCRGVRPCIIFIYFYYYKRKVDTRDELFARILDAAALKKIREDETRPTARDLRTRVLRCTEVENGIFEHLLLTVTNLPFLCTKFFISVLH